MIGAIYQGSCKCVNKTPKIAPSEKYEIKTGKDNVQANLMGDMLCGENFFVLISGILIRTPGVNQGENTPLADVSTLSA